MNEIYQELILSRLLSFSAEKTDIEKAKKEWTFNGSVIDHGPIKDQMIKANCTLCGHPIRYGYVLENKTAGRNIEIGSECINNYELADPVRVEKSLKNLKINQYNKMLESFRGAQHTIGNLRILIDSRIKRLPGTYEESRINDQLRADLKILNINNEAVVYKGLTSGTYRAIADKFGFSFREDYITEFLTVYQAAPKKAGFFRRPV